MHNHQLENQAEPQVSEPLDDNQLAEVRTNPAFVMAMVWSALGIAAFVGVAARLL